MSFCICIRDKTFLESIRASLVQNHNILVAELVNFRNVQVTVAGHSGHKR